MLNPAFRPGSQANSNLETLLTNVLGSEKRATRIASKYSIGELPDLSRIELQMRDNMYDRLMSAIELGRRVGEAKQNPYFPGTIKCSDDAIAFCKKHFCRLITDGVREEFHVLTLDTKNRPIQSHQISVGTLDASLVHPRETFRMAIKDSASSIVPVHNHPSGDPTPSPEDYKVTQRLEEAGKLLGIDVLDHIVVARTGTMSVREEQGKRGY